MYLAPEYVSFIFGSLLAGGGYMGYSRKGSVHSLRAGLGFGAVYVITGVVLMNSMDKKPGITMGLINSAVLTVALIPRLLKTRFAPVPVGITSVGIAGIIYYQFFARK